MTFAVRTVMIAVVQVVLVRVILLDGAVNRVKNLNEMEEDFKPSTCPLFTFI